MVTIASLDPVPFYSPNHYRVVRYSWIRNSGIGTTGTFVELVVKVNTPVEETLNVDTVDPLKLKLKGMVSTGDHVGVLLPPPNRISQEASKPDPLGYSLSVFSPPGFPSVVLGR